MKTINQYLFYIECSFFIFISIIFIAAVSHNNAELSIGQKSLSQNVIRLHILANSDSCSDQNVKLVVRDNIVKYLTSKASHMKTINDARVFMLNHLDEIKSIADTTLASSGMPYTSIANITNCNFPDRFYGTSLFPEGKYEACRVILGNGKGHNWWCVLYPPLCMIDESLSTDSETPDEDIHITHIRFKLFDMISSLFKSES